MYFKEELYSGNVILTVRFRLANWNRRGLNIRFLSIGEPPLGLSYIPL